MDRNPIQFFRIGRVSASTRVRGFFSASVTMRLLVLLVGWSAIHGVMLYVGPTIGEAFQISTDPAGARLLGSRGRWSAIWRGHSRRVTRPTQIPGRRLKMQQ